MGSTRDLIGAYQLEPTGRPGFPWAVLHGSEGAVVEVGRFSFINLFLGRGQRIRLPDGTQWRLRSANWHRFVCPMLVDSEGRRLATSAPGQGIYAVTCRDRGFTLIPAEQRKGRPRRWELVEYDEPVAAVRRNPYEAVVSDDPVPLSAVLMSFMLAAFGVMGEKDLVLGTSWAVPQSG